MNLGGLGARPPGKIFFLIWQNAANWAVFFFIIVKPWRWGSPPPPWSLYATLYLEEKLQQHKGLQPPERALHGYKSGGLTRQSSLYTMMISFIPLGVERLRKFHMIT